MSQFNESNESSLNQKISSPCSSSIPIFLPHQPSLQNPKTFYMKIPSSSLPTNSSGQFLIRTSNLAPNVKWVNDFPRYGARFTIPMATSSTFNTSTPPLQASSSPAISSDVGSGEFYRSPAKSQSWEENIEKVGKLKYGN